MNTTGRPVYQPHDHDVPCYQAGGRTQNIFGHRVRMFRCPVCGATANFAAMKTVCSGKRIRKVKIDEKRR